MSTATSRPGVKPSAKQTLPQVDETPVGSGRNYRAGMPRTPQAVKKPTAKAISRSVPSTVVANALSTPKVMQVMSRNTPAQGGAPMFLILKNSSYEEMIARVHHGIPVVVLDEAANYLHVTKGDLMGILSVKPSSLSTWANKGNKVLPQQESDRIARMARVTGAIEQMIGSEEDAVEWLNTPVPALGSQRPISLLGSDAGAKLVEDTLFRALAGVYA
jgi:putative toxin-antitoxin system antitoxin component (TIGR02293 family)